MRNHEGGKEGSEKKTKSISEEFPETLECVSEVMTWVRLNGAKECDDTRLSWVMESPKRIMLLKNEGFIDRSVWKDQQG